MFIIDFFDMNKVPASESCIKKIFPNSHVRFQSHDKILIAGNIYVVNDVVTQITEDLGNIYVKVYMYLLSKEG